MTEKKEKKKKTDDSCYKELKIVPACIINKQHTPHKLTAFPEVTVERLVYSGYE